MKSPETLSWMFSQHHLCYFKPDCESKHVASSLANLIKESLACDRTLDNHIPKRWVRLKCCIWNIWIFPLTDIIVGQERKISLKLSIQSSLKSGLLAHNSLTLQKMFNITTNVEKHKAPLGMNNITFSFTCFFFFFTCCLKVGKCAYQFHRGMPYHAEWCNPHHTLHQKKCKNTQTVCLLCVSDI